MEFKVRHLALFLLFSITNCFKLFWLGSLHKNIECMLECDEASDLRQQLELASEL